MLALATAALVAVPILSVGSNVFATGQAGTWAHLAATVLPDYIATTLWLCAGVGLGVTLLGVGAAWLVTRHQFPGRAAFEWALVLPLAVPAYVMAYTYTDLLQYVGPVQTALREAFGWRRADYWFPDVRSTGGAVVMFSLVLYPYVYLMARTAFLERGGATLEVARSLGLSPWQGFLRVSLPMARPGHCRWRGPGADGDPGRFRHRQLLRGADLHHRHLPGLVLAGRPGGGGAAGAGAAGLRHPGAGVRAAQPWWPPLCRDQPAPQRRGPHAAWPAGARCWPGVPARCRWPAAFCCPAACCCTWR